ncbi:hypothetical protein HNE05_08135 [Aquipseudomonas campi]|uniref:Uncharacterized protein n=1 Tax=Aquipseudomonas campi TaxID=2731681 RepID=A0A6M8FAZ1_9GAMM|nr:hypothetical protein [Pseudomonas campi]QKE63333.1 hypothetical protein HNE05_08135 [Pseudomonas campi]
MNEFPKKGCTRHHCAFKPLAHSSPGAAFNIVGIEFPAKTNQVLARELQVGHSAVFITCVRLDARCLTTGSSRSLRSLGTAFRSPLTKRYMQSGKNMAEISQYDIETRNKYLSEAKSVDFLNATFCIYFYNRDVKRWGPRPKPEDISPSEVFKSYDQREFDQAIERCTKLIKDSLILGNLALNKSISKHTYQKSQESYLKNNSDFSKENLSRALSSGMRDMR